MRWTYFHVFLTYLQISLTVSAGFAGYNLQTAVYDEKNNRIVYIGGLTAQQDYTTQVSVLDISKNFASSNATFSDTSSLIEPVVDATSFIDASGNIHVMGGETSQCSSYILWQVFDSASQTWKIRNSTGTPPGQRSGARAILHNDALYYFGGTSIPDCSTNTYYYNTLYHLNLNNNNWSVITPGSASPVAEASMSMTALSDDTFVLVGGKSADASTSRATWIGMSQMAVFNYASNAWSYISSVSTDAPVSPRTGHSTVSNGTHLFVYGGSVGNEASTPAFFRIDSANATLSVDTEVPSGSEFAPKDSLYGHSAVLTKQGIMVLAYGMIGTANSTTFNDKVYFYDTIGNSWLRSFDVKLNQNMAKVPATGLAKGAIVGIVLVLLVFAILLTGLWFWLRQRRLRKRRDAKLTYPINRLGTISPDNTSICEKTDDTSTVHLPPWAAMHACQARSNSPTPRYPLSGKSISRLLDFDEEEQAEKSVQDKMVQMACPSSPRMLTFTAPRLQLRVMNPDPETFNTSHDELRLELVGDSTEAPNSTSSVVPIVISDEDDLEVLRSRLADSPMVTNDGYNGIQEQLACLGLQIQDSATGNQPAMLSSLSIRSKVRSPSKDRTARRLKDLSRTNAALIPRSSTSSHSSPEQRFSPYLDAREQELNDLLRSWSPASPLFATTRHSWSTHNSQSSLLMK